MTVFDDRPALANHQFFPAEAGLRVGDWDRMEYTNPGALLKKVAITLTTLVTGFLAEPLIGDLVRPLLDAMGLPGSAASPSHSRCHSA